MLSYSKAEMEAERKRAEEEEAKRRELEKAKQVGTCHEFANIEISIYHGFLVCMSRKFIVS